MAQTSLAHYQRKRQFDRTPEPRGIAHSTSQRRFVVQKHDATNLHYDLRLEDHGVMLSWAVPKGPSLDPRERHLAAHTEDHPLEYRHFEGVIPSGYGAGTVMVWDQGTFEWVRKGSDHLSFILNGKKLRGEFALVRLPKAGSKAWLLLKKKDRFASSRAALVKRKPNSVITGRSLQDIEHGKPAKQGYLKTLPGARTAGFPRWVEVMKPTLVAKPFTDPEWLFETKWDGFRGLAFIDGRRMRLLSRNRLDLLGRFAALKNLPDGIAARRVVLDGEIVSLDRKGISHFSDLREEHRQTLQYRVFDLLYVDGYDLRTVPLEQRKALLRALLRPHPQLKYSDHVEAAGTLLFTQTGREGHEGIVAKERQSTYQSGKRTRTWLKIKHQLQQEFVIIGWKEGMGARANTIGSLLLGVYEGSRLVPTGHVGSGFNEQSLASLLPVLKKLETERSGTVHFVRPKLVAEVHFEEWTGEGQLRQPVFLGLRTDKSPREVVREQPALVSLTTPARAKRPNSTSKNHVLIQEPLALSRQPDQTVTLNRHEIALTNLNKTFWRTPHILKRDVINYYYRIAPLLLPYLANRPLSLKRYPEGAGSWFFYQKNVPPKHPRFVQTVSVQHSQGPTRYVMVNNLETLLWLANLADLEMHPWYSRKGSLNYPDFVVFDLDPTRPDDLDGVREVALLIKEVLDHFGLVGYPKSSGSRGIHIYVPIENRYRYEDTKFFAKRVTELVHHLAPRKTTLEFYKAKRQGVYVDYLQNIKGKTLASVYSLRAKPGAPISAALTWREVARGFKIRDFNLRSIVARLEHSGDLFAEVLTKKQSLRAALKTLRRLPD